MRCATQLFLFWISSSILAFGAQHPKSSVSNSTLERIELETYTESCGNQTVKVVRNSSLKNLPQIEYIFPLDKILITSQFECRYGFFHGGIDLAGLSDSPISSIAAGEVVFSGFRTKTGNTVIIYHPESGIHSLYGHGSKNLVKKGEQVTLGQEIQLLGNTGQSTGPHLHLELSYAGALVNPCALFKCRM